MQETESDLDARWTRHHGMPPTPETWVRAPLDWRETYDLIAGHQAVGSQRPGAALDDNPRAVWLVLPEKGFHARREYFDATGEEHWTWGSFRFDAPCEDELLAFRHDWTRPEGRVVETARRIEIRRSDRWNTLLAYLPRKNGRPTLACDGDAGRIARAAAVVLGLRWPAGPPRVVLVQPPTAETNAGTASAQ